MPENVIDAALRIGDEKRQAALTRAAAFREVGLQVLEALAGADLSQQDRQAVIEQLRAKGLI